MFLLLACPFQVWSPASCRSSDCLSWMYPMHSLYLCYCEWNHMKPSADVICLAMNALLCWCVQIKCVELFLLESTRKEKHQQSASLRWCFSGHINTFHSLKKPQGQRLKHEIHKMCLFKLKTYVFEYAKNHQICTFPRFGLIICLYVSWPYNGLMTCLGCTPFPTSLRVGDSPHPSELDKVCKMKA